VNFFKLFIGDYQRDTAHMTIAEHGAYMLMLQHYYATEKPLPSGKALHRMLRAQDKTERDAIDAVVAQFWLETDAGLVNERADKEIAKAEHQRTVNREIGKLGGRKKKTESVSESVSENRTECKPNDNPNHSQTPDTIKNKVKNNSAFALLAALGVSDQTANDWIALRKTKKAPVTQTALNGILLEAGKAGLSLDAALRTCCERGWAGFKADWLKEKTGNSVQEARLSVAEQIMGGANGNARKVVEINPRPAIEGDRAGIPENAVSVR
jgi:uncharacterized protein YdaU (DUF1376 family)